MFQKWKDKILIKLTDINLELIILHHDQFIFENILSNFVTPKIKPMLWLLSDVSHVDLVVNS